MAEEKLVKRFGELVRRLREERGYSEEEFSFRVGLHQTYVSSVEHGERNVTIGTADRMAKALAQCWRISSGSWSEDRLAQPTEDQEGDQVAAGCAPSGCARLCPCEIPPDTVGFQTSRRQPSSFTCLPGLLL
jgi:DNA-binding XRE family transcriptional regulator